MTGTSIPGDMEQTDLLELLDEAVLIFRGDPLTLDYWNPAARRLLGYTSETTPDLYALVPEADLLLARPSETQGRTLRLRRVDGSELQVLGRWRASLSPPRLALSVRPLSPAQEALERFELAMQCAEEGLWSWAPDSQRLFLSPPYKAILGYADHELENRPRIFEERVHPEDLPGVMAVMARFERGETAEYRQVFRMRHRDGHHRWIRSRAVATRAADGHARLVVGTHVDITVQQNALTALQNQEALLRQIVDELPQHIFWKDTDCIYRGCNAAYPALVGKRNASEILGKDDYALFDATEAEIFRQHDREIMAHNCPRYRFLEAVQRHGEQHWMETSKIPLHDSRGQVIGLLGITEDVTERERTARLREAYNQRLTREVAERTAELSRARDEAEQARRTAELANRAKSRFLATMSHELRTPLNGILGYAQILQHDAELSDTQREGVEIIQRSGDYLLTLIDDVLDLARVEANRVELQPSGFSLLACLQSLADLFRPRAEQKGIGFRYQALSALPDGVYGDEKRLRQVLINLLSNAVKFTEAGEVVLTVAHHHGRLRFQVEDSGVGIDTGDLSAIFEPFQQVGERHHQAQGTGLGLAISQGLVGLMGGEIRVKSQSGRGSVFWFDVDLPAVDLADARTPGPAPRVEGYHGPTRRLLVVDGTRENRAVLRNLLTPLGFTVLEADDGPGGLAMARRQHPDLILTDTLLPGLEDHALVRQLRGEPVLASIPVIAVSASVFEHHRDAALAAGYDAFLAQPIRLEALLTLLGEQLRLRWRHRINPTSTPVSSQHSGAPLDPEESKRLVELAISGDIEAIRAFLAELGDDPRPVLARLRQLVADFQVDEIIELARRQLAPDNDEM